MTVQVQIAEDAARRGETSITDLASPGFGVEDLRQNFERLAEAAGGISQLRGLVLDLAVRGRLVQQNPEEGTGEQLLARLRGQSCKAAMTQSGGVFFDVPPTWRWATLGDTSSYIQRGKSPKYAEQSKLPVVSQKCVQWEGFLLNRARFIDPESLSAYEPERFLRHGDLLWNSTGHGTVGRIAEYKEDPELPRVVADSHVTVLRSLLVPRFVWCWVASPTVQRIIDNIVSGSTKQTELATATVVAHAIPVPPLAEQKRIVAKVDQLIGLIDELEAKQIKKRDVQTRLRTSALDALINAEGPEELASAWKRVGTAWQLLFDTAESTSELRGAIRDLAIRGVLTERNARGDPASILLQRIDAERQKRIQAGEARKAEPLQTVATSEIPFALPESWSWTRLGNLCWKVADGPHFSPKYVGADVGVPFLSGRNIKMEGFELGSVKHVSREDHATFSERVKPQHGDVLYTNPPAGTP